MNYLDLLNLNEKRRINKEITYNTYLMIRRILIKRFCGQWSKVRTDNADVFYFFKNNNFKVEQNINQYYIDLSALKPLND